MVQVGLLMALLVAVLGHPRQGYLTFNCLSFSLSIFIWLNLVGHVPPICQMIILISGWSSRKGLRHHILVLGAWDWSWNENSWWKRKTDVVNLLVLVLYMRTMMTILVPLCDESFYKFISSYWEKIFSFLCLAFCTSFVEIMQASWYEG